MPERKELTIVINNVLDSDKERIIDEISKEIESNDITYTLRNVPEIWPKMKLGDYFKYNGVRFVFICYVDKKHKKARAVEAKALFNNATVDFIYFSTENSNRITFK